MTFDSGIALALAFSTENRKIVRFDTYGVREIKEDPSDTHSDTITEKCEDNDAQAFGVYAIVKDGNLELPVWIADLEEKESAKLFRDLLSNIFEEMQIAPINNTCDFISSSFASDITNLKAPFAEYFIEPSSCAPNWFCLILLGEFKSGHKEGMYSYSTAGKIKHDISLAAAKYGVSLKELPENPTKSRSKAFYHIELANDCVNLYNNHTPYPYNISKTGSTPESFTLTIETGDGENEEYLYSSKTHAEMDINIAYALYKIQFVLTEPEKG